MISMPSALMIGAIAAALPTASISPSALKGPAVRRMKDACRATRSVCLTFDDGPGPKLTPKLLELLRAEGVRATFYLLGARAQATPEIASDVVAAGHETAAHSMHHRHAWKSMPWSAYQDVEEGYRGLSRWVGHAGRFRPPYGKLNVGSWLALRRRGAPIDWWTIDSGDTWARLPAPGHAADCVARDGGGVVLLHDFDRVQDAGERSAFVIEAVRAIIHRARELGLNFRTMSELHQEHPAT